MAAPDAPHDTHEQGWEDEVQIAQSSRSRAPRQQRACEMCRHLKVKCIFDENDPNGSCIKCTKLRQPCTIRPYYRKKRTKKADTRVADLERRMEALVASLEAQNKNVASGRDYRNASFSNNSGKGNSPSSHTTTEPSLLAEHSELATDSMSGASPLTPGATSDQEHPKLRSSVHFTAPDLSDYVDVIDQGLLTAEAAYAAFYRYPRRAEDLPFIVFPAGIKAEEVRRERPLLFLAVLAAADNLPVKLSKAVARETNRLIGMQTVVEGRANLELLQAILVNVAFMPPPGPREAKNYTYLIGLAVAVACDLEIHKRIDVPDAWREAKAHLDDLCEMPPPVASKIELKRTWLAVYYMASLVATLSRRPPMLQWNTHTEECVVFLETSTEAIPSDKWLAYIVRCQRISEEAQFQFGLDGVNELATFSDPRIAHQLRSFDTRVNEWHSHASSYPRKDSADLLWAATGLHVHDIGLERVTTQEGLDQPISPTQSWSLLSSLQYIHQALESIISFPHERLRSLPTVFYVRVFYSCIMLVRLEILIGGARDPLLGLTLDDLKVSSYLSRLQQTWNPGKPFQSTEVTKSTAESAFSFPSGNDDMSAPLMPETPIPNFDLDMMDFGMDDFIPVGVDSMIEGMGMGWMTSGFNFNTAV
ncbi:MAG: hypothetical protein Q9227_004634 [Pyrenula ochraceoflavens]